MMNRKRTLVAAIGTLVCLACLALACCSSGEGSKATPKEETDPAGMLREASDAEPLSILEKRCAGCHGGVSPKARLSLEPERLLAAMRDVPSRQIDSLMLVDTRVPGRSYLLMKIRGDEGIRGSRMPDDAAPLSGKEIETIELWVRGLASPRFGEPAAVPETTGSQQR